MKDVRKWNLTPKERVDIVNAFVDDLVPMMELGKRYDVSRHSIYKTIKKAGVDIQSFGRMDVSCTTCGEVVSRPRMRIRKQKHHFCGYDCYYAFLEAGNGLLYVPSRQGQRVARQKVGEFFGLQPGHVVHHEDRNCLNNDIHNLVVFRCQGDHVRHHRGFEVVPLWKA